MEASNIEEIIRTTPLPSSDLPDISTIATKSNLNLNKHDSTDATESSSTTRTASDSDTASVYSTKDADVIHQRQKEKRLKKKSLLKALANLEQQQHGGGSGDSEEDYGSQMHATVGTSKISERSFRATRNLERLKVPIAPYKLQFSDEDDDYERIQLLAKQFDGLRERARSGITDTKLAREASMKWLQKVKQPKEKQVPIRYEPTYRLQPKETIRINAILNRISKAFEILVKKNERYDVEYTPKFAMTASDLFKNEVKKFNYDRYKIIVQLIVLQKVVSQSCLVTSACLWNQETDKKFFLKYDTNSLYALCYVFMVYHE